LSPQPHPRASRRLRQRGGFAVGLVVGLLIGLALALSVALYVTKAPIPFIDKVPQRTAAQDTAEAERNRHWDPNAGLAGRSGTAVAPPAPPAAAAGSAPAGAVPAAPAASGAAAATASRRDPAAILSGAPVPPLPGTSTAPAPEAFVYFVQAGAFTRQEDAEQQRAKLALQGLDARISEREQAGRTIWRVRIGPFPARDAADALQVRLQDGGFEAQIVRVEKP
jgi:cell division protein FtsN